MPSDGKNDATGCGGTTGPSARPAPRFRRIVRNLLPVLIFLALSLAGIGAWSLLVNQHKAAIDRQTEAIAEQYAIRIEDYFVARLETALFMRDSWALDPEMGEAAFRNLAAAMHARFPAVLALNWIDARGVIRWVYPVETNRPAIGLNVRETVVARESLAKTDRTNAPSITPPLTLVQGGRGIAAYLPLRGLGPRGGYINVVFRIDEVFPALWRDQKSSPFTLLVRDRGTAIVQIGGDRGKPAATAGATAAILDRSWDITVHFFGPVAPGLLSNMPYALPPVLALLLSALVGWLLFLHLRQVEAMRDREAALRISESRLRSFLDNTPSMVVIKDLDGRYELVNQRIEEWFGVRPDKALGCSAGDFFDAETAERLKDADRFALTTGRAHSHEHRKYFADGVEHILVGTKFPIRDKSGQTTGTGSIVTDVTEQRRAEGQLRQIQKMEAVGNMTGGLAHDFNNLLTIILGNLQMLERRLDGDDVAMVDSAIRAARRASEVTQRLLAFSRRHPLAPERVDLEVLVMGLQGLLVSAMGPEIELKIETAPGLWRCHVDQGQLESALVNLAINARDAMPNGGRLHISMANVAGRAESDEAGPGGEVQDRVKIVVADTGVGMPRQVLDQAVDPFFTTKARGQGTGLGLSMVYGFVNQSGGDMHIDSAPGKGTRVTLRLPRAGGAGMIAETAA